MPEIRTKRWDDTADPEDGTRLLICRFRPRGVRKEDETWTVWHPQLGPSPALHAAAYGKTSAGIDWTSYVAAYRREMQAQQPLIQELAQRVRGGETITLLCSSSCTRESRCHRSLLKQLIESAPCETP